MNPLRYRGGSLGPGTHELRAVMEDVVGVLPGGVSDEIVLIGAHYDSTYGGAMDNGTGVAGMLALMRHYAAKARSERPRTLVFLAAGGHDCGGDFDLTHFMQTHLEDMLPRVITFAWLDHLAAAGTIRVTQSSVDIPHGGAGRDQGGRTRLFQSCVAEPRTSGVRSEWSRPAHSAPDQVISGASPPRFRPEL